jgi:hypothetical protein
VVGNFLISINQRIYAESDNDLVSFIQAHQIYKRQELDLTYDEFLAVARYFDLEIAEDILISKEFIRHIT